MAINNRKPNQINTYALFINPRQFLALEGTVGIDEQWTIDENDDNYWKNRLDYWSNLLCQIDYFVEKGFVEYASLTEIAEIYEANEDKIDPNFGEIPRTRMSKMERSKKFE